MFINAVLFGVEENVRKKLNNKTSTANEKYNQYKIYAISGAIAGLTQSFLLSPVELIKIKMQLPNSNYRSTWQCTRDLIANKKNGGLKYLLTRGTLLTCMRDVPAVSSYFTGFEYMCNSLTTSKDNLTVFDLLMAGGVAGCASWLITYPIDVIKTRYQADSSYTSIRDCLRKTFKSEGHMSLWRGLSPTLLR
jgi:solute carrier family 25 carnitine/acylcarnitine transporter 20/29